jgi:hypothetical protein
MPKDTKPDSPRSSAKVRDTQPQKLDATTPTRGSSVQGERQGAKGGPAGANQGGASRGGSRVEPSHQQRAAKKDRKSK